MRDQEGSSCSIPEACTEDKKTGRGEHDVVLSCTGLTGLSPLQMKEDLLGFPFEQLQRERRKGAIRNV